MSDCDSNDCVNDSSFDCEGIVDNGDVKINSEEIVQCIDMSEVYALQGTEDQFFAKIEASPDTKRKDTQHWWSTEESLKLIEIVQQFKEELENARNRRSVWLKIHEAVVNHGINVALVDCQNKWKNLIRSYKECCKIKNPGRMKFKYFSEMRDYFGPESIVSMDHDYDDNGVSLYNITNGNSKSIGSSLGCNATITFPPICFTDRQFIEYTKMKREEYARRQRRHDEELKIKKELLEVQKKQLEVFKKRAMANPQNRNINFDFPCRWPDEATSKLISIITTRKHELADKDHSKKPDLWRQIRQELVQDGHEVTVKECKMKWRNLIRTYNLRCRNQRQKGFKFKFFEEMQSFFEQTEPLGLDPVVFHIYPLN